MPARCLQLPGVSGPIDGLRWWRPMVNKKFAGAMRGSVTPPPVAP